ncbi:hypothetical protein PR202_gb03010 [Eleusine coracana subsp. coracana]|uniref:Dyskerin-like domain-containing protein n=1 Tax=Eleusine coracana subsp. coracana TaxID=191504 RepID=A0AAV5E1S9_ELECO|nr:hypothetical protein PR202_gb03010 [Eleusine coracana subsp. coracana]
MGVATVTRQLPAASKDCKILNLVNADLGQLPYSPTDPPPCRPRRRPSRPPSARAKSKKKKKSKSKDAVPAADPPSLAEAEEKTDGYLIKPQSLVPSLDTSTWPLLLKNYDRLNVRTGHYTPLPSGHSPLKRPLAEYLRYGVINLDKPSNPSSHEVVAWIKRLLRAEKTGHSGTLDPKVTGNLIVCIDRATRLVKSQQGAGKEYVCVARFHAARAGHGQGGARARGAHRRRVPAPPAHLRRQAPAQGADHLREQAPGARPRAPPRGLLDLLRGRYLCSYPSVSTLGCSLVSVRICRSCAVSARESLESRITHGDHAHDVMDGMWALDNYKDESYLRRIVMPLEVLLTSYKRLVVKDSAVNAICYVLWC